MQERLFQWLKFRVGIEAIDPDGRVLVFSIPSRPFGTAYEHKGAYYMRSGECLVPMSEDKLRHIFSEGEPAWLDEPAQTEVKLDDLVNLLHVQKFFELSKLPYPSDDFAAAERLEKDRWVERTGDPLPRKSHFSHWY